MIIPRIRFTYNNAEGEKKTNTIDIKPIEYDIEYSDGYSNNIRPQVSMSLSNPPKILDPVITCFDSFADIITTSQQQAEKLMHNLDTDYDAAYKKVKVYIDSIPAKQKEYAKKTATEKAEYRKQLIEAIKQNNAKQNGLNNPNPRYTLFLEDDSGSTPGFVRIAEGFIEGYEITKDLSETVLIKCSVPKITSATTKHIVKFTKGTTAANAIRYACAIFNVRLGRLNVVDYTLATDYVKSGTFEEIVGPIVRTGRSKLELVNGVAYVSFRHDNRAVNYAAVMDISKFVVNSEEKYTVDMTSTAGREYTFDVIAVMAFQPSSRVSVSAKINRQISAPKSLTVTGVKLKASTGTIPIYTLTCVYFPD